MRGGRAAAPAAAHGGDPGAGCPAAARRGEPAGGHAHGAGTADADQCAEHALAHRGLPGRSPEALPHLVDRRELDARLWQRRRNAQHHADLAGCHAHERPHREAAVPPRHLRGRGLARGRPGLGAGRRAGGGLALLRGCAEARDAGPAPDGAGGDGDDALGGGEADPVQQAGAGRGPGLSRGREGQGDQDAARGAGAAADAGLRGAGGHHREHA
mmetsp:Transcript_102547/g.265181  ORF Transcript_102547/g.265181 Transcript_102547/m.265181 type:complete len:214 (-) Transcript_102547:502-1143(-)